MVLTFVTAVLYAVATYLGIKVSLDPPTARQRTFYRIAFIAIGVVGVGLTVLQERTTSREFDELRAAATEARKGIEAVREQTKQPPNVRLELMLTPEKVDVKPPEQGRPDQQGIRDELCSRIFSFASRGTRHLEACVEQECDVWKDEQLTGWRNEVTTWARDEGLFSLATALVTAVGRGANEFSFIEKTERVPGYAQIAGEISVLESVIANECVPGTYSRY